MYEVTHKATTETRIVPVLPYKKAMFTSNVDIDIGCPHTPHQSVKACCGDNYKQEIACTLYRYGEPWIPPADVTVLLRYETPVGGKGKYWLTDLGSRAWKLEGNVLTFVLDPRVNNHVGVNKVRFEIRQGIVEIISPYIEVQVCADGNGKQPVYHPDEYADLVYFDVCGVTLDTPKEVVEQKGGSIQKYWEKQSDAQQDTVYVSGVPIVEDEQLGSGSRLDPIHYNGAQCLSVGAYYIQDDEVYRCVLGTNIPAVHRLVHMKGMYVELDRVISETGPKGTKNDPIQYDGAMDLEKGKVYVQNGVLYLCVRSATYHPASLKYASEMLEVAQIESLLNS